jgi:hypothetical protein
VVAFYYFQSQPTDVTLYLLSPSPKQANTHPFITVNSMWYPNCISYSGIILKAEITTAGGILSILNTAIKELI